MTDVKKFNNQSIGEEIANAIERLLLNEDLCETLAKKALEYARAYTWNRAVQEIGAFLEIIASERN